MTYSIPRGAPSWFFLVRRLNERFFCVVGGSKGSDELRQVNENRLKGCTSKLTIAVDLPKSIL